MADETQMEIPQNLRLEDAPAIEVEEAAVPEADPQEPSEARPLTPREKAMQAVYARRVEAINKEVGYAAELAREAGLPVEPTAEEEEEPTEPSPAPEPAAASLPVEAPQQPVPQRHRIEIGGQAFEVDDAQLMQLAQQGALANLAMHQANAVPQPPQPQPAPAKPSLDAEAIREAYRKIQFGSEEEGTAALHDILTRAATSQPQIDPAQIAAQATQNAMQQLELQHNLRIIGEEFPEIFKSNALARAAALELTDIRARDAMRGVMRPNLELYREACASIRGAFPDNAQPRPGATTTASQAGVVAHPMGDRVERKRAAPRNPVAVSRAASAAPTTRAPSGSEIVARMRQARGQASMS